MNRRSFFKTFGVLTAATIAGVPVIKAIAKTTPKPIKRKLKAIWTVEAEQDLQCYYNINVEKELIDIMSRQMQNEIDQEMIDGIKAL